jgi:gamma-glutamyl-gamma-aminobutyrate hydrolase PuuD
MSPNLENVKNIVSLVDNNLLKIPDLEVIGLYHNLEIEDYADTLDFITKNNLNWIRLEKISCPLSCNDIFKKNECTNKFMELFHESKGILIAGDFDIPPNIYGDKMLWTTRVKNQYKCLMELSFLYHILNNKPDKPFINDNPMYLVLGICDGMQSMNVVLGGTLYQHIPIQMYNEETVEDALKDNTDNHHHHANFYAKYKPGIHVGNGVLHKIIFVKGKSNTFFGNNFVNTNDSTDINDTYVLSAHYQAINKLGSNLFITSFSKDVKIPESIMYGGAPNVLGVGYCPESRYLWDKDLDYREQESDPAGNYIAEKFLKSKKSVNFHKNFWNYISKVLL